MLIAMKPTNETNMCDRYSCLLPDSNLNRTKNAGKT